MRQIALTLFFTGCILFALDAQSDTARARIALFEPAGQKSDAALTAVLDTVAESVELSLDVLQRYEVTRLPPADPAKDLARVRAYCQANRIDQAILGSGTVLAQGGYLFKLVVYDRRSDSITLEPEGSSSGALDMFDVTDKLVGTLLDGLSGTHLVFGSLSVETDPAGATVSVNGKEVGTAPLSLRGLPTGAVQVSARLAGHEDANAAATIADGEATDSSLNLARSTGTLALKVPRDAVISVRSTEIGQKDFTGPGAATLPTGSYDVQAGSPGMPAVSGKVTIARGASTAWLPWPKGYLDVQAEPVGATILVDGVDRGVTPRVVDVEPGALHHVELKKDKYQTYVTELAAAAADKVSLNPEMVQLPGSIRVETSIAGAAVKLDYYLAGTTPFVFNNVDPGDHVVEISNVKVGKRLFTVGDPVQVQVNPDETAVVSETFAEGMGQLAIQDSPTGSIVQIDGQTVDAEKALAAGIDVPAGFLDVAVTAPDSGKWTSTIEVDPGKTSWASTHAMTWALPRRTIALDGKPDSWEAIEPLSAMFSDPTAFMGDTKVAMTQVYLCRDDKYLYWRVDFARANPMLAPPPGMKQEIDCQLSFHLDKAKELDLGVASLRPGNRLNAYAVIFDDIKQRVSQRVPLAEDFKTGATMLVGRLRLDEIARYCKTPVEVTFGLGDNPGNGNWDQSQISETRLVDLSR